MWGGGGGGGAEVDEGEGRKKICERGEGRAAQKTMAMGGGSRSDDGVDRHSHRLICDETRKARGGSLLGLAAPLNDVDECIRLAYSPSPSPPSCSLFLDPLRKEYPRYIS